ncbi:MAG: DNA repair protein RadC [Bacteroidetes bacterium]|nr:DNA repair protein RadC [Bacteroidota bacterium]MBK7639341.1 DNA repair protein RadC [Bacteroidota bacterium]MBK8674521.1 DNA repair protein RadC [Bacteroidota bacterium]MBK9355159.1 DNA repair protein RadC [Bacteroidota bacterium]MBP7256050.1 DNA repair protein RadC [Chitinophagales bacterium]
MLTNNLTIKSWSEEDRPREKLTLRGKGALTDAELFAILLHTGTKDLTAVELAQLILQRADNNLHKLSKLGVSDLMEIKGVGPAKAISIVAAMEIGRRRRSAEIEKPMMITSSKSAFDTIYPHLADLNHEEFWVIYLDIRGKILSIKNISSGGLTQTLCDLKIIFNHALKLFSPSIVLFHNHPSGNLKPSEQDIKLTKKIRSAGEILDIKILDHIIIGIEDYFSFADNGL